MKIIQQAVELIGIVFFRFRIIPRVWAIALVTVNLSSVFFLYSIYGQVAAISATAGVIVMVIIYSKCGFIRLLGIGHIFWIPMIAWMVNGAPFYGEDAYLSAWLWCLAIFNSISLLIDATDITRYVRGERQPYYTWEQAINEFHDE